MGLTGIIFSFVLFWGIAAHSQEGVEVTATVDRNQVGVGDTINLSVTVSAKESVNVEEPPLPEIKGFELINTSSGTEVRSAYTNGRFVTEQARTFNYMMAVLQPGTLVIPPITVNVDGKAYTTKPIQLAVSSSPRAGQQRGRGQQRGQPDPFAQLDEEEELFHQMLQRNFPGMRGGQPSGPPVNPDEAFFIQTEVDKQRAYVGEQITVSFYIYTRGQIRDIDTLKYPDLKGFWKEEIEMATRLNFEGIVINGIAYQRALLVSYALFPIKAGKVTVDSYKAKCTVLTPSTFGFGRPYQFTKVSKPIPIEVMDVPTEGRPSNFTGAVGRFRLAAQFDPPTGVANQPTTLRVRIEGQGNAKLIELPKLELPPSFELYDQKSNAKFLKDGTSFKEFEVLIIPREPGVFQVPPLSIGVFDPETKKFANVASQPLNITVTGTALAPGQQPAQPQQAGKAQPKEPQLPALATDIDETSRAGLAEFIATILIFVLVAGFLLVYGWRKIRRKPKKVSLHLVLNRRLKNIRALAAKKEYRRVGVEMTNAAYYILGQVSEQGGANLELALLLEKTPPSLRNELSVPIQKLLAQCEALSFAPESLIGDMTEKSKLEAQINEFERVLNRAIELAGDEL